MLGQRTSMNATVPSQSFNNHQTKYYYDGNYQLTRADYPNVAPFNAEVDQWTYDAIGNRLANIVNGVPQNYAYYTNPGNSNNGQRLQSDGSNTYTYDNNGNMISKSGGGGNFTFTYDYENRLIAISGSSSADYTYDYIGRRSSKNVGGTTTYIYNGQDLIGERGASIADFLFGPRIDEPLAMQRSSTTYYFNVDSVGSVSLLNGNSGSIQNKYLFDAWGVTREQTTLVSNPFGYTSREFAEAGILFYRMRFYNNTSGKFLSEDPLGWLGGTNLYAYVTNKPVIYSDPSGLEIYPPGGWGGELNHEPSSPAVPCGVVTGVKAYFMYPTEGTSFVHCWASCEITKGCGTTVAEDWGNMKEDFDKFMCEKFDHENSCKSADQPEDFESNKFGRSCPETEQCWTWCETMRRPEPPPGPYYKKEEKSDEQVP